MTTVIKVTGNTVTLGLANNLVGGARLVRIINTHATLNALITQFDTVGNVQIGTIQISPGADIALEKNTTDAITSNNAATVLAVPIAYRY